MKNNYPICQTNYNGSIYWTLNGKYHREDGPAIQFTDGTKYWYFHGQYHRADGPAIEYTNGHRSWWYYGQQINCFSQEEFERLVKLKALW